MNYKRCFLVIIILIITISTGGCYKNSNIEMPVEIESEPNETASPSIESNIENRLYWLLPTIEYDTLDGYGLSIYNLFFPFKNNGFTVGANLGYRHIKYHTFQSAQIEHPIDFYVFSGVVGYFINMSNFSPGITAEVMYFLSNVKEPKGEQYDVYDGETTNNKEAIRFYNEIGERNTILQKAALDNFGCRVNLWIPYQYGDHLVFGGNVSWIMYPKAEFTTIRANYKYREYDTTEIKVDIERNKIGIINLHVASFGLFVGGRW